MIRSTAASVMVTAQRIMPGAESRSMLLLSRTLPVLSWRIEWPRKYQARKPQMTK